MPGGAQLGMRNQLLDSDGAARKSGAHVCQPDPDILHVLLPTRPSLTRGPGVSGSGGKDDKSIISKPLAVASEDLQTVRTHGNLS